MVKFSLLVPVLNEEKNIGTFLDLILNQELVPEIVFADGGSTDKTISIIKGYKNRNIKLIELGERGTGKAINAAFDASTGDYVIHAGADWRFYDTNIFSDIARSIKGNPGSINIRIPADRRSGNIIKESIRFWDIRNSQYKKFAIVRRDLFPRYPDISYGEDRIATSTLRSKNFQKQVIYKNYNYERDSENLSLINFIKRYLWYGRTYNLYLKECKDPVEYMRLAAILMYTIFPPLLIIPGILSIFQALKFLKTYSVLLITFPLLAMISTFFMGIGYLLHFVNKDLGH